MIPKIIHYCWFGPKPIPSKVRKCLKTWKKFCPDYAIMLWNESNSPLNEVFPRDALQNKKYAFVADYVRTWALYTYGGIYMDTDMLVVKPLDDLLVYDCVLAYEKPDKAYLNVAFWGASMNNDFVKRVLDCYSSMVFNTKNIESNAIPLIVTAIYNAYEYPDRIKVFSYDWFYPFPGEKRRMGNYKKYITSNTYAVHLWNFSWLSIRERLCLKIKKILCYKNEEVK